jgi:hypothetical protein
MRRRLGAASDSGSLELLLDTLCNVFGGIVLIACLLAILPRQSNPPLLPSQPAQSELLERRLANARVEAERLAAEIKRLSASVDPALAQLQAKRDSLRELEKQLEEESHERDLKETGDAEIKALLARGDPDSLKEALSEMKQRLSKSEGIDSAAADKVTFLEQRIAKLSSEAESLAKGRFQAVRFPRERNPSADPFPIILRYGAVYPLQIGKQMLSNPSLRMEPGPDASSVEAIPLEGKGSKNPGEDEVILATLKQAASKRLYATIYLYPDSHDAFVDLQQVIGNAGISYGLEFIPLNRKLFFSSEGSAPPEL